MVSAQAGGVVFFLSKGEILMSIIVQRECRNEKLMKLTNLSSFYSFHDRYFIIK